MEWSRNIVIDRPRDRVHGAVADEHRVMQWSAWPQATGYSCAVEGDGRSLGSAIVFTDREGVEQGRQRLTLVRPDRVEYRLRNRGPGGRDITPEIDFRLEDLGGRTRVHLDFRARAPLPPLLRQVAEAVIGRRVRRLHDEDLKQLKVHVEATTPA